MKGTRYEMEKKVKMNFLKAITSWLGTPNEILSLKHETQNVEF